MKKSKKKADKLEAEESTPRDRAREAAIRIKAALDWRPLLMAFRDAMEWALDIASALARDFPEEVAAVERVRSYLRKRMAGVPADLDPTDLLFTFGLLMGAIERDIGPIVKRVGAAVSPAMWFPGVDTLARLVTPFSLLHSWERLAHGARANSFARA